MALLDRLCHLLCCSICVCVSATVFQHLLCMLYKQSIAINDNLDHLRHLCYSHIPTNPWYDDIRFYLKNESAPHHLDPTKRRALRLKSSSFHLVNGVLFHQNFDGILMRCLEKDEAEKVLLELHAGEVGGHFGGDTTTHKFLRVGYYWPTPFRDAHALCRKCIICQKASGWLQKPAFPL
jgi:hypothetical protein